VVIRGHSWSFVVIRGHSWSFVVIRGHLLGACRASRYLWLFVVITADRLPVTGHWLLAIGYRPLPTGYR